MSVSARASASSLNLYFAQFVVWVEAFCLVPPWLKHFLWPQLTETCRDCSYTSHSCIIISKYKIANNYGTYCSNLSSSFHSNF